MGGKANRLESIIAMGVLLFVLCIVGSVYYKYYGHSHKTSTFYAEFDSITGLNLGAPVKINGVVVGKVVAFSLDSRKNFVVNVGFSVDKNISIPEDTRASVSSESLFGSTILILSPGMSEAFLAEGGTIFDTQSPLHLQELLQKFLFNASDNDQTGGAAREHDHPSPEEKEGSEKEGAEKVQEEKDEHSMVYREEWGI